jgi:hypothetical protein
MRMWGILLLVVLGATACRNRYDPVHNDRRVARFERNLISIAARDSGCSPMQVQPMRVGETVWVANTCSGAREYHLACRSRGRRWANCGWTPIAPMPMTAAQVLQCPPQAIAQQPGPMPLVRMAQGCGRGVQMSLRCNEAACGWMPDGPPQIYAQAPPQMQPQPPPPQVDYNAPRVVVIPPPPQ